MIALLALILILAIFGGLGFVAHALWIVLLVLLVLWQSVSSSVLPKVADAGGTGGDPDSARMTRPR